MNKYTQIDNRETYEGTVLAMIPEYILKDVLMDYSIDHADEMIGFFINRLNRNDLLHIIVNHTIEDIEANPL
jgi:hypothetical protein